MFTPHAVTVLAQALLALIFVAIGVWVIDPMQILQGASVLQARPAYAIAFYAAMGVASVAFPRLRRNDIALVGLALACMLESIRAILGHDAGFLNLAAAAIGVVCAWAPGVIEQLRRQARLYPFLSFRQIHDLQRRGAPGRNPDAAWPAAHIAAG